MTAFDSLWPTILDVGRHAGTGGYRRFAWSDADLTLREWFAGCAEQRGMDVEEDRNGNMWAWWMPPGWTGDPRDAFVTGSHLDSVPDGGAFDGPLGVVSAFAAIDILRERGVVPAIPVAVVAFSDEEGARFGVACVGSQLSTGALTADRASGLRDADGITLGRGAGSSRPRSGTPRRRSAACRAGRGVRRAARRAGPRAGPGERARRRRVVDLAARPVGVHVRRRSQPRRIDPTGRPPRPHAGVRVFGALGADRGGRARRGRDVRQGDRLAQRGQRHSVADPGLARRARGRRGDADRARRRDNRRGAAARRGRFDHARRASPNRSPRSSNSPKSPAHA